MPMTSNAGAKISGTRAYSGLSFVPDICDFRVLLIAALSGFTPSTLSLTAGPTIDDSNFILNQMVQNKEGFKRSGPAVQILLKESVGAERIEPPSSIPPARPITLSSLVSCGVSF